MTRRLLALLALLIVACAQQAPAPRGAKGGDGTLRLSFVGEPRTLNPNLLDEAAILVTQNIYSRLISLTADGDLVPDLAERWSQSDDGLAYTFELRPDVRWHDGRPFSAEDVRTTLLRVVDESSNRDVAARIASVQAPDARTVVVRLDRPWAAFLPALAWFGTSILPAHIYGSQPWTGHPANARPIGTGPFRFTRWDAGSRIVLDKNEDYFGPGPYVDQVEYLFAKTADEGADLLLRGRADLLLGRPPADRLPELMRSPQVNVSLAPSDGRTYLMFNLRRAPFGDVRVRRAINLAIDRRALVEEVFGGIGAPALGFYTPTVGWAYNGAARAPDYDAARGRRELDAAGARGAAALLLCSTVGSFPELADALAGQLAKIGLAVRTRCLAPAEYLTVVLEQRDFDLALMAGAQGPDPDNLMTRFGSSGAFQPMGYANPELDAELARGSSSSDMAVRASAYLRAQEILAADLPIAPLAENVRVTVSRTGVRGLPQGDARGLVPEFAYNLVRLSSDR